MEQLIKGIHHVSMKCRKGEQYQKVISFYRYVLGLRVLRTWGENEPDGVMFDTGNGAIEIFTNASDEVELGIIRHFALETDNVDACIQRVKEAGYEVFIEPKDIVIPSNPPLNARIAFCFGPLSEQIEFFQVRKN